MNRSGARHWSAMAAILAGGSLLGWVLPASSFDWQPDLVVDEPWRCWSAAFVHWSEWHLAGNLAGLAVLTLFGRAAGVSAPLAAAWVAAWPLTHLGLLAEPALVHYGGLSGVLHAGVAVVALALLWRGGDRCQRWIGAAVAAGLVAKVLLERPWAEPLRRSEGWDIAIAPIAHASGALAGAACAAVVLLVGRKSATGAGVRP